MGIECEERENLSSVLTLKLLGVLRDRRNQRVVGSDEAEATGLDLRTRPECVDEILADGSSKALISLTS